MKNGKIERTPGVNRQHRNASVLLTPTHTGHEFSSDEFAAKIVRKKFLRQNRDIARVNSAQSLKIRSLETECGRLLSENLTLNGRILELERELDESRGAQRIADHALEIRAKMEAKLAEWGAMLQGMGMEPAAKRHASASPSAREIRNPRRSPAATRRPRDSKDNKASALQESRLPPIMEYKTYPRRTMKYVTSDGKVQVLSDDTNIRHSYSEILAIHDEEADANESPDLGPPPTSRFVEEDPVKIDSPTRSTGSLEPSPKIKKEPLLPTALPPQPMLEPKKRAVSASETARTEGLKTNKADQEPRPVVKAGSKRKFGDENDEVQVSREFSDKVACKATTGKPLVTREPKSRRSIQELANPKPMEKRSQGAEPPVGRPRKPLGEKSANDDLLSPKKATKAAVTGDPKKTMAGSEPANAPIKKKRVVPITLDIPNLEPPIVLKPPQEPETPSADPGHVFPDTPETKSVKDPSARDTPPPADISVHGETSRPSRRARAAISYAEPNLRDKMRRPTKELYDAVTGEGKFKRSSSNHLLEPGSIVKSGGDGDSSESGSLKQPTDAETAIENEAARRPNVVSPLLQRDSAIVQSEADLPDSILTKRRRRPSSRQSQLFELADMAESTEKDGKEEADPYEFQSTSPSFEEPKAAARKGRSSKGTRKSMGVVVGVSGDATEGHKLSRKRVSMAAPKKALMLEPFADADSSYEAGGEGTSDDFGLTKDRVSRRRSMML